MSEQHGFVDTDDEPLYNIGAVSRMTGVAETTLRVWERRYDFPNASRSEGGHRLYSQHEVMRLQWVKAQIDEGMQISQAIKALLHTEQEGRFAGIQATSVPIPTASSQGFGLFYDKLLQALLDHDAEASERVIAEALTVYPLEHMLLQIISPIMNEVGQLWEDGEVDVATEHFATNVLRHQLLQWMRISPPAYNVSPVVLACAPGELHEGSLLMLGVLLRRLRWPVSYLGQSASFQDFAPFVEQLQPSAIVFVAMTEQSAQSLSDWPRWLPEVSASKRPVVCYGGRIFSVESELVEQIPGIFLGQTLEEGVSVLNRLLHDMHPLVR